MPVPKPARRDPPQKASTHTSIGHIKRRPITNVNPGSDKESAFTHGAGHVSGAGKDGDEAARGLLSFAR